MTGNSAVLSNMNWQGVCISEVINVYVLAIATSNVLGVGDSHLFSCGCYVILKYSCSYVVQSPNTPVRLNLLTSLPLNN